MGNTSYVEIFNMLDALLSPPAPLKFTVGEVNIPVVEEINESGTAPSGKKIDQRLSQPHRSAPQATATPLVNFSHQVSHLDNHPPVQPPLHYTPHANLPQNNSTALLKDAYPVFMQQIQEQQTENLKNQKKMMNGNGNYPAAVSDGPNHKGPIRFMTSTTLIDDSDDLKKGILKCF